MASARRTLAGNRLARALAAGFVAGLLAACASAPPQGAPMPLGERVLAPAGLIDFCRRNEDACQPSSTDAVPVALTPARWRELNDVNFTVNRATRPVTDLVLFNKAEHWDYPNGAGDCEDFALEKRRMLIARGWPEGALLFATARIPTQELHAVLVVATDHGDFVLDNASDFVALWDELPYRWVARQTPGEVLAWQRAGTESAAVATASLP